MSLANQNIEDLITRCKEKDQRAEFEIYNRYCKAMYNVAYRIVNDEHFAEDVLQEGFLKAFLKIKDYKQEVAFGAWLKRIIINHSIDFCKKSNQYKTDGIDKILYKIEDAPETETTLDFTHLKAAQVLNTIQSLKESYRMMLTLFFIEGYDQEEICEILDITYANCRTTMSRAKESLRNALKNI